MSPQFSLEGLLRLRRLQKDQAGAELGIARTRAGQVAARQRAARAELVSMSNAESGSDGLNWVAAARASTASNLVELDALEAEWQLRMEDARRKFAEAKAAASALEKLEERHSVALQAEENRSAQLTVDEIAVRSWHLANGTAL
ncbi:MAG TPA: flagellar export protein FliJ [Galbitalea sp.]